MIDRPHRSGDLLEVVRRAFVRVAAALVTGSALACNALLGLDDVVEVPSLDPPDGGGPDVASPGPEAGDSSSPIDGAPGDTSAPGVPGSALVFDGVDDHVSLPAGAYAPATGFSWELWLQPTSPPIGAENGLAQVLVSASDTANCEDIYLAIGAELSPKRSLAFVVDGAGDCAARDGAPLSYDPPGGFEAGRWYHAVAVRSYAGGSVELYLDGVRVANKALALAPIPRAMSPELGRNQYVGGGYFAGWMDEVRFYARPLTSADVAAHHAAGRGTYGVAGEEGLLAGFHLDENGGLTASDYSGAAHDGTLQGPAWGPGLVARP